MHPANAAHTTYALTVHLTFMEVVQQRNIAPNALALKEHEQSPTLRGLEFINTAVCQADIDRPNGYAMLNPDAVLGGQNCLLVKQRLFALPACCRKISFSKQLALCKGCVHSR